MATDTRKRLIAAAVTAIQAEDKVSFGVGDLHGEVLTYVDVEAFNVGKVVDAILAELLEPDETACEAGADATNARSDHGVHEFFVSWRAIKAGFTAMIDVARTGEVSDLDQTRDGAS